MKISIRSLLLGTAAALQAGCAGPAPEAPQRAPLAASSERPPNIVLILADDLGWADLGVYGSTFYETPNLDGLAAEGMRFTDAYAAAAICSPSRASLLTGRSPARVNLTDWVPGQGNEPHQKLLQVEDNDRLPLEEVTIAELLRDAGFTTAHIGKWHLGGDEGYRPTGQGFDIMIGVNNAGSPPTYFWPYQGNNRDLDSLTATGHPGENLTDRLGAEAARFIAEHRNRPFFLYLPFYAPHTPLEAKPELVAKYRAKAEALGIPESRVWGEERGHLHRRVQSNPLFAGMVETMDAAVGRVLRSLESNGVADNTVVIFLSDNGGLAVLERPWVERLGTPPTSNLPLRAGKGWLYEGGTRVPLIVRWPGAVRAAAVEGTPVITDDFLPTLLEVAGVEWSADRPIDGLSLVPLLRGTGEPDREELYWHYPHYHGSGQRPSGAVRSGDYKLIEWYEDGRLELYDLSKDPGETVNLAAAMPERAARLRERLARWREATGAQMPLPNPDYKGAQLP